MILNEMHLFLSETCCCCNQIGTLNFDRSKVNKGIKKSSERERERNRENTWNSCVFMHPKWTIIHGNTHRCSNEIELRIIASIRFVVWAWPSASDVSTFWLAPTMKKGKKEIHSVKIIICSFLIVKIMAVYVVLVFDCRRSWFWPNSSVCVNNSDNSKCVYVHFQASLSHKLATIYYIWRFMSRLTPNTNHANNL